MAEPTSPTFFVAPPTTAWSLQVLEGLCLLTLRGFSKEQLRVSMYLSVLLPLPLQVMWSPCVPWGVWTEFEHRVWAQRLGEG